MNPAAFSGPAIGPVPVEFILFACVLAGVAMFHHHTLRTALGGAIVIALYKIVFSPFRDGRRSAWLRLAPASRVGDPDQPAVAAARLCAAGQALRGHRDPGGAAALAARRLEGLLRAAGAGVRVVELPRQHRRGDDRRRDRAHRVQGKVHVGFLAAIVAASNGGGSGSVVGDTTTTMMWIAGIHPLEVLEAFIGSGIALVLFGIPASLQQQHFSPIQKDEGGHPPVDWVRVGVVAFHPGGGHRGQRGGQHPLQRGVGSVPLPRGGGVGRDAADHRIAPSRVEPAARCVQGLGVPAVAGVVRIDDAGGASARRIVAHGARPGLPVGGVRQHSAHRAGASSRAATTGASWPTRSASAAR